MIPDRIKSWVSICTLLSRFLVQGFALIFQAPRKRDCSGDAQGTPTPAPAHWGRRHSIGGWDLDQVIKSGGARGSEVRRCR